MKNKITITPTNLVDQFYKEYESKNGKFLLFDLANANENANTKVLKYLLQYNNCQFLNSFLNRIGLPIPNGSVSITDQKKAIGPKAKGFIDLYIQYDDVHIIIENKIYGAGDAEKQLARYIAKVNGISNKDFDAWYTNPSVGKNTYVVYLTADGTKEPSADSLPEKLENLINYYPINYNDDILPWLEEEVMPNIPYAEDGMMIAGIRQYIAFLKQLLTNESSKVVDAFVEGLNGSDVENYYSLLGAINPKIEYEPENVIKSLRKELGARAEAIFSGDVTGEWVLHFTPSFIVLYKKSWAALDTRKYSIPSLYLYAGSRKTFLEKGYLSKLTLQVDHLSPSMKQKYPNLKYENHDKTVAFKLLEHPDSIKCSDVHSKEERKEFYNKIIEDDAVKLVVDLIDDMVVGEIQKSGSSATPDEILEKVVASRKFLEKYYDIPYESC